MDQVSAATGQTRISPASGSNAEAPDILLVEDNLATAELFKIALKANKSKARLHVMKDGAAALNFLLGGADVCSDTPTGLPRVLLLDLNMPRIGGLEVLRRLRANERTSELPILVYSASDWEADRTAALRFGANAYVLKPVGFTETCQTIAQIERDWLSTEIDAQAGDGHDEATVPDKTLVAASSAPPPTPRSAPLPASASAFTDLFVGGGEMGELMRATDWSQTRLGPVEAWPSSLKTMLGVVLGSRFPMLLWWGPELLHLYNDAYRPILRDKHPASLAAPAAQIWAEVWDIAGPMARSVQEGGPATWTEDLQLFITSGSMAEETYFTFSYSPVPGDDGKIGGLLNTVQETTAKVQGERQIRMLRDLAARAAEAYSERDAYRIAVEVLAANELDLPFVLFYALDETENVARLVAAAGWRGAEGQAPPEQVAIDARNDVTSWPFAAILLGAGQSLVDNLSARFEAQALGRWNARTESAMVLPLVRAGQASPCGFLVAGVSPHRKLDERYRAFFCATADQVANVLATARAYDAEKKRAESLAEIDAAKTAFFSNVSHEFRTPLTLILGLVEDALAGPRALSGEGLDMVHRNGIRLLRLVNSLLDFTRIEAGRLQLSFEATDLAKLTSELAGAFCSLVERAGMKLHIRCPSLPELVYVDRAQWEKIVLNLVSNAFKFTFEGEIEVALRWRDGAAELCVRDTGTGIAPSELPHIFERFHRVEHARGRSFEGTGIGLALVQDLVKLHGGTIRVASVEGEGSCFIVTIPGGSAHLPPEQLARASAATDMERAGRASAHVLEASQWRRPAETQGIHTASPSPATSAEPAETYRILLVDDNPDMRDYIGRLLSPHWMVETACDGLDALASARAHAPDLILSDVMMPGLDGFGLVRELRADWRTRTIPVLLLSARAGEEAVLEGLDQGADDYLAKPFTTQELLARVRTHLNMARVRNEFNVELSRANRELEAFSHSVAHDLRVPLRSIDGFSSVLLAEYGEVLGAEARTYLGHVLQASASMNQMIEDMLMLARVGRTDLRRAPVDLSAMAREVLEVRQRQEPGRGAHRDSDGTDRDGRSGLAAHCA